MKAHYLLGPVVAVSLKFLVSSQLPACTSTAVQPAASLEMPGCLRDAENHEARNRFQAKRVVPTSPTNAKVSPQFASKGVVGSKALAQAIPPIQSEEGGQMAATKKMEMEGDLADEPQQELKDVEMHISTAEIEEDEMTSEMERPSDETGISISAAAVSQLAVPGPILQTILSLSMGKNQSGVLTFATVPGASYRIERSRNLGDWGVISKVRAESDIATYNDTNTDGQPTAFYRVIAE